MSASSPSKASATNSSPDPCRHDTPPPPLSASLPPSRHSASVFAPVPAAVPTHYTFVSVSVPAPTGYSTAASGTPHICLHIRLCPCLYRLRYSPPPSFLCPPALRIRIRLRPFSPAPCTPPPSLPQTQPPFPSVSAALPAASTASLHPHHVTALPYHSLYLRSPSPPLRLLPSALSVVTPHGLVPAATPATTFIPFVSARLRTNSPIAPLPNAPIRNPPRNRFRPPARRNPATIRRRTRSSFSERYTTDCHNKKHRFIAEKTTFPEKDNFPPKKRINYNNP